MQRVTFGIVLGYDFLCFILAFEVSDVPLVFLGGLLDDGEDFPDDAFDEGDHDELDDEVEEVEVHDGGVEVAELVGEVVGEGGPTEG